VQQNVISHYLTFKEVKIMFGNFSEQMKKSTKPASALLEMNAKTLELVSKQQTVFFSGLMSDSVKLLSNLNEQTELKGVIAAQSVYAQSVKERLTSASKTTYSALNEMREELSSVVKTNFADASEEIETPATPAPASKAAKTKKAAPAKKSVAAQKATPVVAKQVTPTKPAQTVKPQAAPAVAEKPKVSKAPAKKAVAKKSPVAKKATAPKADKAPTVTTKPTVKKTVAQLSPADVKAESSKKA
jgi:phasin family protein